MDLLKSIQGREKVFGQQGPGVRRSAGCFDRNGRKDRYGDPRYVTRNQLDGWVEWRTWRVSVSIRVWERGLEERELGRLLIRKVRAPVTSK